MPRSSPNIEEDRTRDMPGAVCRQIRFNISDRQEPAVIGASFCDAVETVSTGLITMGSVNREQIGRLLRSQDQRAYDGLAQFLKNIGITRIMCQRDYASWDTTIHIEWNINFVPGPAYERFMPRPTLEPRREFTQPLEAANPQPKPEPTIQSVTVDDTRDI